MIRTSFLQDLLATIFERSVDRPPSHDRRSLAEMCKALLSERGEASGTLIAAAILGRYEAASAQEKQGFFQLLERAYDLDCESLIGAAETYRRNRDFNTLSELLRAAEPPRQELLRRLNRVAGATGRLVKMREDLLAMIGDEPSLRCVDLDFQHLFSSWFNRGFLVLRRIDWATPANILEKIIAYEAVHRISDWDDLRRRLEPPDRRCFAFFHPAMPDEPLIFVEVALTTEIAASVQQLLSRDHAAIREAEANTAVFYSISNCQRGLAGVSFGNFLIKQVATDLSQSLPNLKSFTTLSPVPGFARWLSSQVTEANGDVERVKSASRILEASSPDDLEQVRSETLRLAAEYVLHAKRSDGLPLDPVARFHLGNGARVERIQALADTSSKGLAEGRGVMVNYSYDLNSVEANHEAYIHHGEIIAARSVRALLGAALAQHHARGTQNA
ncbi:malonyl-CoA decarboxylase [Mesorhizobium sp. VK4C]|uniref:malonyl-CoA decarboxylase n=1 Tax=Mesorhizobium captivum TaxID=3072319 RepID=UPI002A239C02|nr:malonyl-CoA decarboxylase [Mesorhizobium sp. VK4C]MDX8501770.1 malonyl-CoA decarboxylase [Mesorhizobium sp. VK4C]